jgi:hypothetical protein
MILINIMSKKSTNARTKKPIIKPRMLRLPQELDDWLVEYTKERGAASVQETMRQILTAARASEREQRATA